jgi:hypothetical protein
MKRLAKIPKRIGHGGKKTDDAGYEPTGLTSFIEPS